eukprot:Pgem_evm2s5582
MVSRCRRNKRWLKFSLKSALPTLLCYYHLLQPIDPLGWATPPPTKWQRQPKRKCKESEVQALEHKIL